MRQKFIGDHVLTNIALASIGANLVLGAAMLYSATRPPEPIDYPTVLIGPPEWPVCQIELNTRPDALKFFNEIGAYNFPSHCEKVEEDSARRGVALECTENCG